MGLEVANLTAKISFKAEGAPAAVREATAVERAVESLGLSLDTTSNKAIALEARIQSTASSLSTAQSRFDAAQKSVDEYDTGLAKLLKTQKEISQQFSDIERGKGGRRSGKELNDLANLDHATKQQIDNYGTLADRERELTAASTGLSSALGATVNAQEAQARATDTSVDSLRGYTNQLKIATATSATMKEAQKAAVDEVQRMVVTTEGAAGAVANLNALRQQEANATFTASSATMEYAASVKGLTADLAAAEGAEAGLTQEALKHANVALENSVTADKEAASYVELSAVIVRLTKEYEELARAAAGGGPGAKQAAARMAVAKNELDRVTSLRDTAGGRGGAATEAAAKAAGRMGDVLSRVGGKAGAAGKRISGFVRQTSRMASVARGGVTGLASMATSIGSLGPKAILAVAALATLIGTFKTFMDLAATSQFAGNVTAGMEAMAEGANLLTNDLRKAATTAQNFWRSLQSTNADALSEATIKNADSLKNLTGGFEPALAALMAVTRGNYSAAEAFGVSGAAIQEAVDDLGPYADEATKAAVAQNALVAAANQGDRLNEANANKVKGFADLKQAIGQAFESLANDFGPVIQFTIDLITVLVNIMKPLAWIVGQVAIAFTELGRGVMTMAKEGTKMLLTFVKPFLDFARHIPGIGGRIGKMADAMEDWANGTAKASHQQELLAQSTMTAGQAADLARQKFSDYLGLAQQGNDAVSGVAAYGDAIIALEKDVNLTTIQNLSSAMGKMFDIAINNGPAAFEAQRNFIKSLGLPAEAEQEMITALDRAEGALRPFTDAMNESGVEAKKVTAPMEAAAGSFTGVDATSRAGATGVNILTSALQAVPRLTVAEVQVHISSTGGSLGSIGSVVSGQLGNLGKGLISGTGTKTAPAPTRASARTPSGGGGGRRGQSTLSTAQADSKRAQAVRDRGGSGGTTSGSLFDQSREDAIALAGQRPSGGGGGGGGGGGEDKNLAIEEIRKFIQQVNKAVLAGIRGGVVYSTAGNAIPIGGPGEFVSNEGGVNIGTINLRGVWDFADPAAKREIVRQMQEALVQYQKEVA